MPCFETDARYPPRCAGRPADSERRRAPGIAVSVCGELTGALRADTVRFEVEAVRTVRPFRAAMPPSRSAQAERCRPRTAMIDLLRRAHARSCSVPRRFGRLRRYERRLRVHGHAIAVCRDSGELGWCRANIAGCAGAVDRRSVCSVGAGDSGASFPAVACLWSASTRLRSGRGGLTRTPRCRCRGSYRRRSRAACRVAAP